MSENLCEQEPLLRPEDIDATPIYPIIHMIRQDMIHFIDAPLTYDAMLAPDLTYTLIRPLTGKYVNIQQNGNRSVVFCFLLNRAHFLRDENLVTSPLSRSRASLCEILAIRTLREYGDNILELALAITTTWPVYSGADKDLLKRSMDDMNLDELEDRVGNAIEMAIIGKAKRFIKSDACQKVIDGIWSGKCVYQAESSHSILSDTYKRTPIHMYDPHKAPLLDHYRLKVPAVRSVLEYINFLILFFLFILALELNELERLNWAEGVFMTYALGFALEKVAAMQEHGLMVYFKGTWNGFDLAFITIYCSYASLRIYGFKYDNSWARSSGIDCLALAACLIFPRLIFVTLKNNLMVLSLRAMIVQFFILMLIAIFCFAGFLYALWTLSRNEANYSAGQIAWWMADLWFGLDATGFARATTFHRFFGPVLMVTYACLSNTLLLTVLVSILSHTFSIISEDAAAEVMFRRAVSTIEGVKADSLFSYQPPINVVAVFVMLPASYVLSPRWFHKVNVFMIRLTSFPILLLIAYYERQSKNSGSTTFTQTITSTAERILDTMPRQLKRLTFFEGLLAGTGSDIDVIFEIEDEILNKHTSALDMRDLLSGSKADPLHQQPSLQASQHQVDDAGHPTKAPSLPSTSKHPQSAESRAPRPRLNSILHRGAEMAHNFTSPLAQIYQPLVVDDDIAEQSNDLNQMTGVSYGPAMRRRLSSMQKFPADIQGASSSTPPRNYPATHSGKDPALRKQSLSEDTMSQIDVSDSKLPETVNELADEEMTAGVSPQMLKRLKSIEETQNRMEGMLTQMYETMKSH